MINYLEAIRNVSSVLTEGKDNPSQGNERSILWHSSALPQKGDTDASSSLPQLSEFPTGPCEGVTFVSDKKAQATHCLPSRSLFLCRFSLPTIYRWRNVKVYVLWYAVFASSSLNDWFLVKGRLRKASLPYMHARERAPFIIVEWTRNNQRKCLPWKFVRNWRLLSHF